MSSPVTMSLAMEEDLRPGRRWGRENMAFSEASRMAKAEP